MDIYSFIKMVRDGSIIDSDGTGYISDGEFMYFKVVCNDEWLMDYAKTYKYVCWFNK